jgi:hypothetical protein
MLSTVMMGQEVECFQQAVEPILYEYGVNLVLTGEIRPPSAPIVIIIITFHSPTQATQAID